VRPTTRFWALVAIAVAPAACESRLVPQTSPAASAAPAPAASAKRGQPYGQPIGNSEQVSLTNVLERGEQFRDKSVVMEGFVRRACSRKGCWMELAAGSQPSLPGCRVTFKDYGFFVPTDSAGSRARVEGKVAIQRVEPQWVAHMEEEGAHFTGKNPDGSANEVRLVATGVELTR
jgi:hypothetical protein